jgi:hypothetical protein
MSDTNPNVPPLDSESSIPSTHTPQHDPGLEPVAYENAPQDEGDSDEFLEQLAGENTDGTAYLDVSQIEPLQDVTTTDVYEGDTGVNQLRSEGDAESYDNLAETELREDETDDVMNAIEEGITYVPPIDPPVVPDADSLDGIEMAAGFGSTAEDESGLGGEDTDHEAGDEMSARIRLALRRDAATSHLADSLQIATINSTVVVRGEVDDLDDGDNIVSVISELPGVEAVRDETIVRGL